MDANTKIEIIKKIARHYGIHHQMCKSIEELSEAQTEIARFMLSPDNIEHLSEELADSLIMIMQLLYLLDLNGTVDDYIEKKLHRQLARMECEK